MLINHFTSHVQLCIVIPCKIISSHVNSPIKYLFYTNVPLHISYPYNKEAAVAKYLFIITNKIFNWMLIF